MSSAAAASEAKAHAHQHASRAEGTIATVTHTVLFARRLRYRQTHVQPQLLTRGLACEDSVAAVARAAGLRSFAAVGELYGQDICGGWVPIPHAQNSSSGWVGAPTTLLKPPVATERLR